MNVKINDWQNFMLNAGFHCMVLGMIGVLALIFIGFLTVSLNLPTWVFYAALGGGLILGIIGSAFCMNCNCSFFRKKNE